jgi:serine/threonine-protein kinase HipA
MMELRALDIFIGSAKFNSKSIGRLYQYGFGVSQQTWFVADVDAIMADNVGHLSVSFLAPTRQAQVAFWQSFGSESQRQLRASGGMLPPFFQNLLPEGVLRKHIESIRGSRPDDHFDMLAACGSDLPGALRATPVHLGLRDLANIVTQNNDALEVSVSAAALDDAISISGVQPKLSLMLEGQRYVGRTKTGKGEHIIAKLPVPGFPMMPAVEELSLRLAALCGVETCEARLAPMSSLQVKHGYVLANEPNFLAVKRFDRVTVRGVPKRIHAEDFAQVLSVQPSDKYTASIATYAALGRILIGLPRGGAPAVEQLWRRLVVNELLGNYDAHLKNFGLLFDEPRSPRLSPAYDIVAYSAYFGGQGHALRFFTGSPPRTEITPMLLRGFCAAVPQIQEAKLRTLTQEVVKEALQTWPAVIAQSGILDVQKQKILQHLQTRPIAQSWLKRMTKKKDK